MASVRRLHGDAPLAVSLMCHEATKMSAPLPCLGLAHRQIEMQGLQHRCDDCPHESPLQGGSLAVRSILAGRVFAATEAISFLLCGARPGALKGRRSWGIRCRRGCREYLRCGWHCPPWGLRRMSSNAI